MPAGRQFRYPGSTSAPPDSGSNSKQLQRPREEPLSFEAAVAIGRGSRQLPSPMPNGYKPGQRRNVGVGVDGSPSSPPSDELVVPVIPTSVIGVAAVAAVSTVRSAASGVGVGVLPSGNGVPGASRTPSHHRSDSDEDDWC